jgi:hypothetical protein
MASRLEEHSRDVRLIEAVLRQRSADGDDDRQL